MLLATPFDQPHTSVVRPLSWVSMKFSQGHTSQKQKSMQFLTGGHVFVFLSEDLISNGVILELESLKV